MRSFREWIQQSAIGIGANAAISYLWYNGIKSIAYTQHAKGNHGAGNAFEMLGTLPVGAYICLLGPARTGPILKGLYRFLGGDIIGDLAARDFAGGIGSAGDAMHFNANRRSLYNAVDDLANNLQGVQTGVGTGHSAVFGGLSVVIGALCDYVLLSEFRKARDEASPI